MLIAVFLGAMFLVYYEVIVDSISQDFKSGSQEHSPSFLEPGPCVLNGCL